MKFLVVLLFCLGSSLAVDKDFLNQLLEEGRKIADVCIPETGATKKDFVNLLAHTIPESYEGKCLIFCFHRHYNMQNQDGSLNRDGAITALQPLKNHDGEVYEKVLQVMNTCSASVEVDSDPCIYAANLAACGMKEGKALKLDEVFIFE